MILVKRNYYSMEGIVLNASDAASDDDAMVWKKVETLVFFIVIPFLIGKCIVCFCIAYTAASSYSFWKKGFGKTPLPRQSTLLVGSLLTSGFSRERICSSTQATTYGIRWMLPFLLCKKSAIYGVFFSDDKQPNERIGRLEKGYDYGTPRPVDFFVRLVSRFTVTFTGIAFTMNSVVE
jgi:hypothetical protein